MNIGELTASLGLDTKNFLLGAQLAKGTLLGLSKNLSKLVVPALAIGGAIALTKAISNATDSAAKLEKSMANVATLVDKPKSEIQELTFAIQEMTTEVLKSSDDLSAGLYQVFSAGITDSAEALEVLRVSAIAATAGISDTRTSVDAITTILNAFKLEAAEATRVSDLLFQTVRLGKTTYDELAGAIGTVTSTAATVGVELEDLFGILATLTKGGIETRRATTGLRATLLSIIKPSEGALKKAKELGIEWNTNAIRVKGLVGFLNELRDATGGSEEAIAGLIPNARALNVVLALVGKQNDELNRIMGEFGDISGSSAEAFRKQADTVESQSRRLDLVLSRLSERFGGLFLSVKRFTTSGLIGFLEGVESSLAKISRSLDPFGELNKRIFEGARLAGKGIDLTNVRVNEFVQALKTADIDLIQFFSKTVQEQQRLIQALGLPSELIPKELKIGIEGIVEATKAASGIIIKTWEQTSDGIKKAFEDLGIVPKAQFDQVVRDTLKSFEVVTGELNKRGELNVETAGKIRQRLIDKLQEVSKAGAESGFIIDDERLMELEGLFKELGDSAVQTSSEVLKEFNKETGAFEITIKKATLDTDRFISQTAADAINTFKDVGLDVTSTLVTDFANMANAHVETWKTTRIELSNIDVSYTESWQKELDKRSDGFSSFANFVEKRTRELNRILEESSSFPGQSTSFPVPVFHRGTLSAPRTGPAFIEKGELIIPAAQNPFNDNRVINNNFNMGSNEDDDDFMERQNLLSLIDKNRDTVSI